MTKNSTNEVQFSGPYMIQDRDHLATPQVSSKASRGNAKQSDQSQAAGRQQIGGKARSGRQAH